jgi:predicted RNase H-like HicB family nuclease
MARRQFVAVLERGENGGYGVFFPDLPGCVSAGDTAEEAMRGAREALALHVEGMSEDGQALPEPSSIHAFGEEDFPESAVETLFLVPVPEGVDAPKDVPVRVNVSLPQRLLTRIDAVAEAQGLTRSGLLSQAARLWLTTSRTAP